MGRKKEPEKSIKKVVPALTPEGRENQMISHAVNLAEQQLLDGTASSQIIVHYLKLASSKEKAEMEKLKLEAELLKAKTEALQSQKHAEELYANAIEAMKRYSGMASISTVEETEDNENI